MATRLKVERVRRDLTQMDLVALTLNQIDQPRLSLLERGVRPREDEAKILGKVLGLSPNELWPELGT
jgi:hypothetical protein